jgi:hypothetical protein
LIGLLVIVAAAGVWVASRALVVRGELAAIATLRADAQGALGSGELGELGGVLEKFDRHSRAAAAAAGDPVWRVAEVVPFIGPNLAAVRTVATTIERVSGGVVTPLWDVAETVGRDGLLVDGAIDVAKIAAAHDPMVDAQQELKASSAALADVSRGQLVGEVASGLSDVDGLVDTLSGVVDGLVDMTALLPRVLGGDEQRSILVMLQNNAELRTGGGITGSFAELSADAGSLELVRQADSSEFDTASEPVVAVPESTTALYGDVVGRFVQNATTTPDFSLSGQLAATWWKGLTGHEPDTVIAIDPLVLRALLGVTGPIELADGTRLTHDGFVSAVMVTPYLTLGPSEQTEYFQGLTERYFDALLGSSAPAVEWISALTAPIDQGRISVWSRDAEEAAVLSRTALGGALSRHRAAGDEAFAVYLNDATGAKMDSVLSVALGTATGSCRDDDQPQVSVRIRLTNDAPANAGEVWPASMTGAGNLGVPAGEIGTAIAVAAPPGWFFGGTTINGERQASVDVIDGGFPTSASEVTIAPGDSAEIDVRFVAPAKDGVEPLLLHTPMLRAPQTLDAVELACD